MSPAEFGTKLTFPIRSRKPAKLFTAKLSKKFPGYAEKASQDQTQKLIYKILREGMKIHLGVLLPTAWKLTERYYLKNILFL